MGSVLLLLAIWMGLIAWSVNVARKRGRDAVWWGALSLVFGIFAVLLLYILPTRNSDHA